MNLMEWEVGIPGKAGVRSSLADPIWPSTSRRMSRLSYIRLLGTVASLN